MHFAILLDKPIPPEGRKPTARECKRFRTLNTNIRPTTSGSWTISWHEGKPFIHFHGRKSTPNAGIGMGWTFDVLDKPISLTRPSQPTIPLSKFDTVHGEPTMCW